MNTQETKVERLSSLLGGVKGSELCVGGMTVSEIVDKASTPVYVYNGDALANQVNRVISALGPEVQLVFSIKSNPSVGVCQVISRQGIGCEVASIGELILAQKAGFATDKTLFIGPGKTDEELAYAIELGIEAIIVESMGELGRVAEIASRMGKVMDVGVRLNVSAQVKGYGMRMGGGSQQFGVDEEKLPELIERFKDNPNVNLVGLHVYAGSQQFDIEALINHCNYVVDLGQQMSELLGRPIQMMDLGGGFGVPYFEKETDFDLESFGEQFQQVISRCKADPRTAEAQVVIELGRYLVAESGLYITRVLDIKESRGKKYVVTDGGMNHHVAATGNFGQVFRKPYPIVVVNRMDEPLSEEVAIVGPNCTPLDIFAQNVQSRKVEVGDLIGVFYSGAYGYSASSLGFLSHPTPAEVMVLQGETYVLRQQGRPDSFLEGQRGIEEGAALTAELQPVQAD